MDVDVHHTIIKIDGKERLKWYTYEAVSHRAYVLARNSQLILLRYPAFHYAPGIITKYFEARFVIGKLLNGSFDDKFNFKEIKSIQYDIKTRKQAKQNIMQEWALINNNEDCGKCGLWACPEECFDKHPGSRIALGKILNKNSDKKIHIAGDKNANI